MYLQVDIVNQLDDRLNFSKDQAEQCKHLDIVLQTCLSIIKCTPGNAPVLSLQFIDEPIGSSVTHAE